MMEEVRHEEEYSTQRTRKIAGTEKVWSLHWARAHLIHTKYNESNNTTLQTTPFPIPFSRFLLPKRSEKALCE